MRVILIAVLLMAARGVSLTPISLEQGQATIIDPENPEGIKLLQKYNVNITQLQEERARRMQAKENQMDPETFDDPFSRGNSYPAPALDVSPSAAAAASTVVANGSPLANLRPADPALKRRQLALDVIRNKVSMVINSNDSLDLSAHQATQPIHDIAVYSLCPPTVPNVQDIFRSNNNSFSLFFDPPTPELNDNRMYMSSAILRLFKMDRSGSSSNGNNSSGTECRWNNAHGDELVRVTVSAYIKKQRKYRKKTFNSIMIQKAYSGWVELNVRFMIGQWQRRNLGLSVDVHDQDENQLSASHFFHPSASCEASDKPFPFSQFQSTYTDSCHKAVPRFPRIDYQYKFCDKTRLKESVYQKRCHQLAALEQKSKAHIRHQHNHNNQHHHPHRNRTPYKPFASFELRKDEESVGLTGREDEVVNFVSA